jgi:hypothetical protein
VAEVKLQFIMGPPDASSTATKLKEKLSQEELLHNKSKILQSTVQREIQRLERAMDSLNTENTRLEKLVEMTMSNAEKKDITIKQLEGDVSRTEEKLRAETATAVGYKNRIEKLEERLTDEMAPSAALLKNMADGVLVSHSHFQMTDNRATAENPRSPEFNRTEGTPLYPTFQSTELNSGILRSRTVDNESMAEGSIEGLPGTFQSRIY